jgi:hypothetical protein
MNFLSQSRKKAWNSPIMANGDPAQRFAILQFQLNQEDAALARSGQIRGNPRQRLASKGNVA